MTSSKASKGGHDHLARFPAKGLLQGQVMRWMMVVLWLCLFGRHGRIGSGTVVGGVAVTALEGQERGCHDTVVRAMEQALSLCLVLVDADVCSVI